MSDDLIKMPDDPMAAEEEASASISQGESAPGEEPRKREIYDPPLDDEIIGGTKDDLIYDRRSIRRKSLSCNKVFAGELGEGDDILPFYAYIVDISEAGMRLTTDVFLPVNDPFHINIILDDNSELDSDVVVRWKREMLGGTVMAGIQFINMPQKTQGVVRNFMSRHLADGKRKSFRLNRVLEVEINIEGQKDTVKTLTMDLSTQGMKITNEYALPEDKIINLRVHLEFEKKPVNIQARVRWQKETTFGKHVIGMQFINMGGADALRINRYIDRVVSGEIDGMKVYKEVPMDVFDNPIKRY